MARNPHGPVTQDICLADGRAHQAAIRDGHLTRAELTAAQVQRAQAINPEFRAFSSLVQRDEALQAASAFDVRHGRKLASALDGLTLSVKGNIPVAGRLWTEGSRQFGGRTAAQNARAVEKLERAGAIFVGTTTLSELAFYSPDNAFEPLALNPWAPARTPGGSTAGGGVAAALGAAVLNLGTDSGGSIRNPACHCGAVGFKPTLARWSLDGIANYTPTVGALGMITRSVADVIAADAILSEAEDAPAAASLSFVVPERLIAQKADEPTQRLFAATVDRLRSQGFRIGAFDAPYWKAAESAAGIVSMAEGAAATRDFDETRLAPALAERLRRGLTIPAEQVAAARQAMAAFQSSLRGIPAGAIILTPTWPFRAPKIYQTMAVVQGRRVPMDPHRNIFVRAANAADAPALTMPAGLYPGRIPFGLHLMGAPGRDTELLSAATAIEAPAGDYPGRTRHDR